MTVDDVNVTVLRWCTIKKHTAYAHTCKYLTVATPPHVSKYSSKCEQLTKGAAGFEKQKLKVC